MTAARDLEAAVREAIDMLHPGYRGKRQSAADAATAALAALVKQAEGAEAEVEKAHAAMTHWLGEANRAEAALWKLREAAESVRDARLITADDAHLDHALDLLEGALAAAGADTP